MDQIINNKNVALDMKFSAAYHSLAINGNTVNFYTTTDASGTPAASFDFPEEIFLDRVRTQFVQSFAFNAETYLTLTYSFINVEALVDEYTAADNSININVKLSAANNAFTLQNDGLHVDISARRTKLPMPRTGTFRD